MRALHVCWALCCAGCPDPATDGPIPPPARRAPADVGGMDAAATPVDAAPPDRGLDAAPTDAAADLSPRDATVDAAVDARLPDPCVASERRPRLALGPSGQASFEPWDADAALPLIRLSQGGSVTPFDLLATDVDADAEGLTVQIVDLDTMQELAFGETGALTLPCRPAVGRVLVDQRVDYAGEFAAIDLLGRRVRVIATLQTATGPVFGGAEGTLEAAQ